MATASIQSSKLFLILDAGTDAKGQAVMKSKQVAAVRSDAAADALHQTAQAFGTLIQQPIVRTERRDVSLIEG